MPRKQVSNKPPNRAPTHGSHGDPADFVDAPSKIRDPEPNALGSRSVKHRSPRSRKSRRGIALRSAIVLGPVVAGLLGLWYGIHHVPWLGPALADGARSVVGPKPVAWAEDVVYSAQDGYNRWRYGDAQPTTYWAVPSGSVIAPAPQGSDASDSDGAAPAAPKPCVGFPPPAFTPPYDRVAAPGDGNWIPANPSAVEGGQPILVKTMVHPDPKRPFAAIALVAMDLKSVSLHAMPGTVEPRTKDPPREKRPGLITSSDLDTLLAAFNGGFLTIHGHYAMMADGAHLGEPRATACTIAIYRDGSVRVRSWPELAATEADMAAFRQTPQCLVEQGQSNPALYADNSHWGAAVGGATVIRRSAIGVSSDGRTLFFGMGDALTAKSMAEGMAAAGANDIAQLDVNHSFPRFIFYDKKQGGSLGDYAATGLVPGFTFNQHDYIRTPSFRDFFYVTRRSTPST